MLRAERDDLLFQVEQQVERNVEEVARPAGGVEDRHVWPGGRGIR